MLYDSPLDPYKDPSASHLVKCSRHFLLKLTKCTGPSHGDNTRTLVQTVCRWTKRVCPLLLYSLAEALIHTHNVVRCRPASQPSSARQNRKYHNEYQTGFHKCCTLLCAQIDIRRSFRAVVAFDSFRTFQLITRSSVFYENVCCTYREIMSRRDLARLTVIPPHGSDIF
jgi:hypothetical protein